MPDFTDWPDSIEVEEDEEIEISVSLGWTDCAKQMPAAHPTCDRQYRLLLWHRKWEMFVVGFWNGDVFLDAIGVPIPPGRITHWMQIDKP